MQSAKIRSAATSPLQNFPDNKTFRVGDVTLDGHGALTGNFSFVLTGQQALRWRQAAVRNDLDEVNKQFDRSLESIFPDGVEAQIATLGKNMILIFAGSMTSGGAKGGWGAAGTMKVQDARDSRIASLCRSGKAPAACRYALWRHHYRSGYLSFAQRLYG